MMERLKTWSDRWVKDQRTTSAIFYTREYTRASSVILPNELVNDGDADAPQVS